MLVDDTIAIGGELHDSSVTLLDPKGKIRFSINEERLTRNKKEGRFPYGALELVGAPDAQVVIAANTREQAEREIRINNNDLIELYQQVDKRTNKELSIPKGTIFNTTYFGWPLYHFLTY